MTWPYALVGLLSLLNALIGGYVFFKNSSRPLSRVFFVFVLGMALLGVGMVLLAATHRLIFDRLIFAGGYLMTFGLVLLSMKFPDDRPLRPATWLIFLPLAALAVLTPFGFMVKDVIFRPSGILEPVNGPGMPAFAVIIGAYVMLSGWEFWKRYRSLSGLSRLQMQYLMLGVGVFASATFICNVLLPALGIFDLNMFGPVSSVVFVGSVAYAIVRHNLLDIRLVIQRGAIYLVLLALVIGFYLALVLALGSWFHRTFYRQDAVFLAVGLLSVCAGVFTVPLLERYFRRATDRFFFKDTYDYAKALRSLSAILNRNMETSRIVKRAAQALKDILRASEARIVLFRGSSDKASAPPWYPQVRAIAFRRRKAFFAGRRTAEAEDDIVVHLAEEYGIEAIVPIFLGRKALGAIVLGPKKSGDLYRDEDAQLLATFSYHAAVALEKARLFERLQDYSGVLEARVRERTGELKQLQEEQNQMMMDISHRLQTPLAAVKSELDFLKRQPDPPEHLATFERSIDGISKFIYDLLTLARLGIRKEGSPKERIDLSSLLQGLAEYFEVMAAEQDITFIARLEPGLSLSGDKDTLEELVMNLVSNAFKYLGSRPGKEVVLNLRKDAGQAVLEVADNGIGIAPEDLERIFERFYRGKQAGPEAAEGTGLGLAISKRIAENHGGVIGIESEPGQGTKVTVRLPLQDLNPNPPSS